MHGHVNVKSCRYSLPFLDSYMAAHPSLLDESAKLSNILEYKECQK